MPSGPRQPGPTPNAPRPLHRRPGQGGAQVGTSAASEPARAAAQPAAAAADRALDRWILVGVLAGGAFLTFTAWVAGSLPIALVLAIIFACAAQGWWRGGAEVAGLLVGTVLALLIAPAIGPYFDGPVSGLLGTAGLQTRVFSIALVFTVVLIVVAAGASIAARRWMKSRAVLVRWNRALGGGIGLVEGTILGFAVLWVPLALEPVARARLAADPDHAAAQQLVSFAGRVRESAVGSLAERTSPLYGSEILSMAEDYAIVSRSPEAMAFFVDQPAMQRIKDLPSVKAALDRLKQDPELKSMFSESSAMSADALLALMRSQSVLEILDRGSLVSDIRPSLREIREALRAAKEIAQQ